MITDEIIAIGPKGDQMCYVVSTVLKQKRLRTAEDTDKIIDQYLREAKVNHYPGAGMTRDEIRAKGWVSVFCVMDGKFWASDAQEC